MPIYTAVFVCCENSTTILIFLFSKYFLIFYLINQVNLLDNFFYI